ncbi:MAG: translocase [Xanthomonadales bacterium]|nr:translocase [Xanthomonadales bacterium]
MAHWPTRYTRLDRLFNRFSRLRPGEGRSVLAFFTYALLMMVSYYILKTIREPLLLTNSSAEMKSYAYATVALLLLFIVPLYGLAFRHTGKQQLTRYVTGFFLLNLAVFYLLGRAGVDIGFAYYVWVGIFSVMITAQFWAFAADSYNVKSGKRLFPVIMIGATLGGLAAPSLSGALFPTLGPWNLMLAAMVLLALTLWCVAWARQAVPPGSGPEPGRPDAPDHGGLLGGFSLVFSDRYLLLVALLIVLLNWVNTTGEYILAELVVQHAAGLEGAGSDSVRAEFIAGFYGNFFFTVNLLTLLLQVFLVARVIRWIGVRGAILVLPVVTVLGYGLVAFLPVFSLIRVVKILENSSDYSLMNTARHALYLPLSAAKKYEGKTAIEAFFWRFGDLGQAGMIYAGIHWFAFGIPQFAALNAALSLFWLWVAWQAGRHYGERQDRLVQADLPRLHHRPRDRHAPPGQPFEFSLSPETFPDPGEGDVLTFTARVADGGDLPGWLEFFPETLTFKGKTPGSAGPETVVIVRATDFDGAWAEGRLVIRHATYG